MLESYWGVCDEGEGGEVGEEVEGFDISVAMR